MAITNTKSQLLRFMATPREARLINAGAKAAGESMSELVRDAAIAAARALLKLPAQSEGEST